MSSKIKVLTEKTPEEEEAARREEESINYLLRQQENIREEIDCANQEPLREWLHQRFMQGYKKSEPFFDKIEIRRSRKEVDKKTTYLCKEGIEQYLLPHIPRKVTVTVCDIDPELNKILLHYNKGLVVSGPGHPQREKAEELTTQREAYQVLIDSANYFEGHEKKSQRVAGIANKFEGFTILLERAYTQGRIVGSSLLRMNEVERENFFKVLSAHETWHLLSGQEDLGDHETSPFGHKRRGLANYEDCLGYSAFQIPAKVCPGCALGVQVYTLGRKTRDEGIILESLLKK